MNPVKGQLVQVRFNNGVFFDAIVEEWSDQKSILVLPETQEVVILQKTLQDVLLVKVLKPATQELLTQRQVEVSSFDEFSFVETQEEFEHWQAKPITDHSLKRMSELKDQLNKMERADRLSKMNEFKANGMKAVNYGIPRNIPINSIAQHTDQEASSPNDGFDTELQGLFSQKH